MGIPVQKSQVIYSATPISCVGKKKCLLRTKCAKTDTGTALKSHIEVEAFKIKIKNTKIAFKNITRFVDFLHF